MTPDAQAASFHSAAGRRLRLSGEPGKTEVVGVQSSTCSVAGVRSCIPKAWNLWSMFSQTRLHQVSHNHSSLCAQESGWSKLKLKRSQHFRGPLACRGCYCNLRVGRVFGPVEDPGMPETAGGASQRPQPLPASQSSPQRLSPSGFVRGCMARQGSEGGGGGLPKKHLLDVCYALPSVNAPEPP